MTIYVYVSQELRSVTPHAVVQVHRFLEKLLDVGCYNAVMYTSKFEAAVRDTVGQGNYPAIRTQQSMHGCVVTALTPLDVLSQLILQD